MSLCYKVHRSIPRSGLTSCAPCGFAAASQLTQGYNILSFSSEAQCVPASPASRPAMKLPLLNEANARRVTADIPAGHEIIYQVRETSLLNGEVNGNGDTNGHSNGGGADLNGDPNGNQHGGSFCNGNGCSSPLMIDKSVQCQFAMSDTEDATARNGVVEVETNNTRVEGVREAEVTVWPSGVHNETVPVTAKTAQLNDALLKRIQPAADDTADTIRAWRKEVADRDAASSSNQNQQKPPQQPNVDDGPRYKINNDNPDQPDPDRNLNNTTTWRISDCGRSSGSSSCDDEIEKISYLEMGGSGEGDKPERADEAALHSSPVRSRQAKAQDDEPEEEECVIRCLAYTLQCCECTIS